MNLHPALPLDKSSPGTIDEVFKLADFISKSDFFPSWKNKPHDAAVAILFGQSLGLSWGHSLLNIAVINGRPTVWGDAMLALCKQSPLWEDFDEDFDEKSMTAICMVKRKGQKEQVRTFSQKDAERAGLWGKVGYSGKPTPWVLYPKRMLQMRARAFALRDVFPDVLQGLGCAEEVMDYPDAAKAKAGSKSESNVVSFPASAIPETEVLPKTQPLAEVLHETSPTKSVQEGMTHPKESSPELKQFVDNLAKFNKGGVVQTQSQPKTAFDLMRERLDEQRQHQQQKGMEAVERLKTLMPALQNGKGV
jgi:hypothetical protein